MWTHQQIFFCPISVILLVLFYPRHGFKRNVCRRTQQKCMGRDYPLPHAFVLAVLTTAMNAWSITAIIVTRKLHHPANYLICSLAVTDLLVAVLVMPFSIVYIVMDTWVMGESHVQHLVIVDITCCTCSICTLQPSLWTDTAPLRTPWEYSRKRTSLRAAIMLSMVWAPLHSRSLPPMLLRRQEETRASLSTTGIWLWPLLHIRGFLYPASTHSHSLLQDLPSSEDSLQQRASCLNKPEMNGHMLPKCSDREPTTLTLWALRRNRCLNPPPRRQGAYQCEKAQVSVSQRAVCQETSHLQHAWKEGRHHSGTHSGGFCHLLAALLHPWGDCFHLWILQSLSWDDQLSDLAGLSELLSSTRWFTPSLMRIQKAFQKLIKLQELSLTPMKGLCHVNWNYYTQKIQHSKNLIKLLLCTTKFRARFTKQGQISV